MSALDSAESPVRVAACKPAESWFCPRDTAWCLYAFCVSYCSFVLLLRQIINPPPSSSRWLPQQPSANIPHAHNEPPSRAFPSGLPVQLETSSAAPSLCFLGNGPSGICLSYLLSGYTPYLSPEASHPNPLLHSKLGEQPHLSLLEQVKPSANKVESLPQRSAGARQALTVSLPPPPLFRIWSTCARGWRAARPIPWPCSSTRCCSPTATSDWTTRRRWSGATSRSGPSHTWCWGRVRLGGPGMYVSRIRISHYCRVIIMY